MTKYLRTSERNLYKRCQWAWERNYVDRLKSDQRESVALWFGTGIHLAMEKYYIPGTVRGVSPHETWQKYVDDSRGDTEWVNTYMDGDFSEAVSAKELGNDMLTGYLELYGDESWMEVISAEQTFQVPIKHPEWVKDEASPDDTAQRVESETVYTGTFDLVYRDLRDNKIYMLDFKTAKALGASNTQYLPLDDQAGAYWAVATYSLRKQGLIGSKEAIAGIVYSYLVKRKIDTRPKNADGYFTNKPQKKHYLEALQAAEVPSPDEKKPLDKLTAAMLESLAAEHSIAVVGEVSASQPPKSFDRVIVYRNRSQNRSQIERIQKDLEAMSLVGNNLLAATKTPTRECGFCEFRELCELDESNKDWTDMAEMMYTTWDPYAPHREKEVQ